VSIGFLRKIFFTYIVPYAVVTHNWDGCDIGWLSPVPSVGLPVSMPLAGLTVSCIDVLCDSYHGHSPDWFRPISVRDYNRQADRNGDTPVCDAAGGNR
jgi:hypothetical protein